jgi:hypothetical protein
LWEVSVTVQRHVGFSDGTPACPGSDRHQAIICSRSYAVRERVVPGELGSVRGVRVV